MNGNQTLKCWHCGKYMLENVICFVDHCAPVLSFPNSINVSIPTTNSFLGTFLNSDDIFRIFHISYLQSFIKNILFLSHLTSSIMNDIGKTLLVILGSIIRDGWWTHERNCQQINNYNRFMSFYDDLCFWRHSLYIFISWQNKFFVTMFMPGLKEL